MNERRIEAYKRSLEHMEEAYKRRLERLGEDHPAVLHMAEQLQRRKDRLETEMKSSE